MMVRAPLIREYISTVHIIVRISITDNRNKMYKDVLKCVRTGELLYKILTLNRGNGMGIGRASIVKINRSKHKKCLKEKQQVRYLPKKEKDRERQR